MIPFPMGPLSMPRNAWQDPVYAGVNMHIMACIITFESAQMSRHWRPVEPSRTDYFANLLNFEFLIASATTGSKFPPR